MGPKYPRRYWLGLWIGSVLAYVVVTVASLTWRRFENSLFFILVLPLTHFALTARLPVTLGHAAVASALAWYAGAAHDFRVWREIAGVETIVFFGVAVACYLFREHFVAEEKRRGDEAAASQQEALALRSKVDQLNVEINKSIFDILAIYEFTTVLGSTLNLTEMFDMMVDTIMRVVRYDACFLILSNEESGDLEVKAARAFTPEQLDRFTRAKPGEGLVGKVLQTAQPLIIPSLAEQSWSREVHGLRFRSMMAIPLVIHSKSIGAICLFREESNAFSQDDLRALFIVANQCAFAVQNGRLYEETARLAITDGLTGLYNHRYFRICIDEAVNRAEKTETPVSMIMVDVDGFKGVNDKYGHQRGDQVLQEMARVITRSVRESDFVARYGGEEFAVILPDTGAKEAYQVASRIHQAVGSADFGGLHLTVSLGVATFPSSQVKSKDDLISMADEFAYRAKESGRNRICAVNQ